MRAGKIERHNLGERIWTLAEAEGLTGKDIAALLSAEGFKLSAPTVTRWLKERRESTRDKAEKIFSDHVERELPKDLEALEEMEKICLAWAKEEAGERAERISNWVRVKDAIPQFAELVMTAANAVEDKEKSSAITAIVKLISHWIIEDMKQQAGRLSAMRQAASIIEIKLRNKGLLGDSEKGRIIIKPYDEAKPSQGEVKPQGAEKEEFRRRIFSVPMNQKAE